MLIFIIAPSGITFRTDRIRGVGSTKRLGGGGTVSRGTFGMEREPGGGDRRKGKKNKCNHKKMQSEQYF